MEKKRIRKTGEIIDVITFCGNTVPDEKDCINCINSKGEVQKLNLNYYWDLENVPDDEVHYWEKLRDKAAIKIFANRVATLGRLDTFRGEIIDISIKEADELIKRLKEQRNEGL